MGENVIYSNFERNNQFSKLSKWVLSSTPSKGFQMRHLCFDHSVVQPRPPCTIGCQELPPSKWSLSQFFFPFWRICITTSCIIRVTTTTDGFVIVMLAYIDVTLGLVLTSTKQFPGIPWISWTYWASSWVMKLRFTKYFSPNQYQWLCPYPRQ